MMVMMTRKVENGDALFVFYFKNFLKFTCKLLFAFNEINDNIQATNS